MENILTVVHISNPKRFLRKVVTTHIFRIALPIGLEKLCTLTQYYITTILHIVKVLLPTHARTGTRILTPDIREHLCLKLLRGVFIPFFF